MDARFRKTSLFSLVLFAAFAGASPRVRAADVVLTAFEPFGGLPVNNSAVVIERLARLLETKLTTAGSDPLRVSTCILPVEYDRAARSALDCIGTRNPDLVLSFGAGDCSLRFETRARNLDSTSAADNAGVVRRNRPIVPGGPEYVHFSAPMREIYRKAPRFGSASRLSDDAGAYVCNNTAYRLGQAFSYPGTPTRYGFIHVPPTSCARVTSDPDAIADTVYRALRRAMPELF